MTSQWRDNLQIHNRAFPTSLQCNILFRFSRKASICPEELIVTLHIGGWNGCCVEKVIRGRRTSNFPYHDVLPLLKVNAGRLVLVMSKNPTACVRWLLFIKNNSRSSDAHVHWARLLKIHGLDSKWIFILVYKCIVYSFTRIPKKPMNEYSKMPASVDNFLQRFLPSDDACGLDLLGKLGRILVFRCHHSNGLPL